MGNEIDYPSRYEQLVGFCRGLVWAIRAKEDDPSLTPNSFEEMKVKLVDWERALQKIRGFEDMIEKKLVEWEEIDRKP